jgi:hypothetical protein
MAEKTVETVHGEAVDASDSSAEKSHAYHSESVGHVGHVERNVGLRIDGDDLDHEHEPKVLLGLDPKYKLLVLTSMQMTVKRIMSLTAMALLWTGSQIPVYLYGMLSALPAEITF